MPLCTSPATSRPAKLCASFAVSPTTPAISVQRPSPQFMRRGGLQRTCIYATPKKTTPTLKAHQVAKDATTPKSLRHLLVPPTRLQHLLGLHAVPPHERPVVAW
ncbi:unnamed protein product, partial [Ectocarpus sp. 13 AM-2016]